MNVNIDGKEVKNLFLKSLITALTVLCAIGLTASILFIALSVAGMVLTATLLIVAFILIFLVIVLPLLILIGVVSGPTIKGSGVEKSEIEKYIDPRDSLRGQWIAWCISGRRGYTEDGRPIKSVEDLVNYLDRQAERDISPPEPILGPAARELWNGFRTALAIRANTIGPGSVAQPDLKRAFSLVSLLNVEGLQAWAWELGKPLIEHMDHLDSIEGRVGAVLSLAATAREQVGNEVSMDLLSRVQDIIQSSGAESRTQYYFALGNSWKDKGDYEKARAFYQEAARIGADTGSMVLGPTYLQLGRIELELGQDFDKAAAYLDKAEEIGVAPPEFGYGDLLAKVTRIQLLHRQGDLASTQMVLEEVLKDLPTPPRYHEESALHTIHSEVAGRVNLPLAQEWCARQAVIAMDLGGRSRERGAAWANLALALVHRRQGPEARYWFAKAIAAIEQTDEALQKPSILCSIGWGMYVFGRRKEAVEFLQTTADAARDQSDRNHLVHSLAQLKLVSAGFMPEVSQQAAEEVKDLLNASTLGSSRQLQSAFPAACELLAAPPDQLLQWPEALRTSKVRMDDELPHLQALLDVHGERGSSEFLMRPMTWKRGTAYGYICGRGFLDFLRKSLGLPAAITMEWILSRAKARELLQRIVLEWMVNPGGLPLEARRGRSTNTGSWETSLPHLRALMMRRFFNRDLADNKKNPDASDLYPWIDPEDLGESLASLYGALRETSVVDLEALDPSHDARVRSPTRAVPDVSDALPTVLPAVERFMEDLDLNQPMESLFAQMARSLRSPEMQRLIQSKSPIPTAMKLGVRLDNFLDVELREPLVDLRRVWQGRLPLLLDLFQGEKGCWWLLVDLEAEPVERSVSIHAIELSREQAEEVVHKTRVLLERQESPNESDTPPTNPMTRKDDYLEFILGKCPRLFEAVLPVLAPERELWLGLSPPWSSIPVEQLPINATATTLLDRHPVVRRDPFGRWLETPGRDQVFADPRSVIVVGDPQPADGSTWPATLRTPHAAQEAHEVASRFGIEAITGRDCTIQRLIERLPNKSIIHISCHGVRFPALGDFAALVLSDGYLLGQELAALDLSECRLAVLSACVSGTGEIFGNAPIESLGGYLLEAGAQTVIVSMSSVHDQRAAGAMRRLYARLLAGMSVSEAVRAAFDRESRQKDGVALYPWVVVGRSGVIFRRKTDDESQTY
jgi:tetratricopeptide (TPR) repeat protein